MYGPPVLIYLGNPRPKDGDPDTPTYTRTDGPVLGEFADDPEYGYTVNTGADLDTIWRDLAQAARTGVTHLADNELVVKVLGPLGYWAFKSHAASPTWVACESHANPGRAREVQDFLARVFECRSGAPDDLEATHLTYHGPPGVGPGCPGWDAEQHPLAPALTPGEAS